MYLLYCETLEALVNTDVDVVYIVLRLTIPKIIVKGIVGKRLTMLDCISWEAVHTIAKDRGGWLYPLSLL